MFDYDDYADFIDAELMHMLCIDNPTPAPSLAEELTDQDANERDATYAYIERDMGHAY